MKTSTPALDPQDLARHVEALLQDAAVSVPARIVMPMGDQRVLFVMPATDGRIAITKLISLVGDNHTRRLPTIQGDIVVFDAITGQRLTMLDGPTVTAQRTAAVSLLAAQKLAPNPHGPLLVVGAGVQGRSHLEAFRAGLGTQQVGIASRSQDSAMRLVAHARRLGMQAHRVDDPNAALHDFALIATCTPARSVVMTRTPREGSFVTAVGAFSPQMVEWSAPACREMTETGWCVVDTRDADHEAGDLLKADIDVTRIPSLADVVQQSASWRAYQESRTVPIDDPRRRVFFKNCGWAGWDLAAARAAVRLAALR